ncbi:MAG: L-histidine N(alpha)-methyltransferase [Nitrospirales bacterium]|nr:L-histidine N(alpha)-methyltransferase [Nitrospirales bacterium]
MMAQKEIFIGSSSEAQDLASKIARQLDANGYKPRRWWLEVPTGAITIDRLVEIAESVDGAIFVFTGDDQTWYREMSVKKVRDNVALEFGLFLGKIGRERAIILKDKDTLLPSDVNALTYQKIGQDHDSVAEYVVDHFNLVFARADLPTRPQELRIVCDPEVIAKQTAAAYPSDWHTRILYTGLEGARAWLKVASDNGYEPTQLGVGLREKIFRMLASVNVRTFVSLGPGDGFLDKDIARRLRNNEPLIEYIPVDISDGLLYRSADLLSQQVQVPVGVLSDIEDRLNFIGWQISRFSNSPRLFSLVGNTLGNLDKHEGPFLEDLKNIMGKGDYCLIDVSIRGKQWDRNRDPRNYTPDLQRAPSILLQMAWRNKLTNPLRKLLKILQAVFSLSQDTAMFRPRKLSTCIR